MRVFRSAYCRPRHIGLKVGNSNRLVPYRAARPEAADLVNSARACACRCSGPRPVLRAAEAHLCFTRSAVACAPVVAEHMFVLKARGRALGSTGAAGLRHRQYSRFLFARPVRSHTSVGRVQRRKKHDADEGWRIRRSGQPARRILLFSYIFFCVFARVCDYADSGHLRQRDLLGVFPHPVALGLATGPFWPCCGDAAAIRHLPFLCAKARPMGWRAAG